MEHRPLGKTGFEVSEIGYGAWGIGGSQWGGADDDESIEALNRAIDLGVDFIDTALAYGDGRSERVVGQVVRERSERIHVATKVPPQNGHWPAQPGVPVDEVFPGDYVRECAERSLRNLGARSHRRAPVPRLGRRLDRGGGLARGRRRARSSSGRSAPSASRSTTTTRPTRCG